LDLTLVSRYPDEDKNASVLKSILRQKFEFIVLVFRPKNT